MKRKLVVSLWGFILFSTVLCAQLPESRYTFRLHGQTRRFLIEMKVQNDTVCVDWSQVRNGRLQKGTYRMGRKSVAEGSAFCWEQPEDGKHYFVPEKETFGILSEQAYRKLSTEGTFVYNGVTYKQVSDETAERRIHVKAEEEATEMWIVRVGVLPVIEEMRHNPLGIDWKMENK